MSRVRLMVLLLTLSVLITNALLYMSLGYWAYGRLLGFIAAPTMEDNVRDCLRLNPTLYRRYREPRAADARILVSIQIEGETERAETLIRRFDVDVQWMLLPEIAGLVHETDLCALANSPGVISVRVTIAPHALNRTGSPGQISNPVRRAPQPPHQSPLG